MNAKQAREYFENIAVQRIITKIQYYASRGKSSMEIENLERGVIRKLQDLGYSIYEERIFGFQTNNYKISW